MADKGGDEAAFDEMRKKYEQIMRLRGESKNSKGGGAIRWDPNSRESMMTAHSDLREQLIWITNSIDGLDKELETLRKRQAIRRTITWTDSVGDGVAVVHRQAAVDEGN